MRRRKLPVSPRPRHPFLDAHPSCRSTSPHAVPCCRWMDDGRRDQSTCNRSSGQPSHTASGPAPKAADRDCTLVVRVLGRAYRASQHLSCSSRGWEVITSYLDSVAGRPAFFPLLRREGKVSRFLSLFFPHPVIPYPHQQTAQLDYVPFPYFSQLCPRRHRSRRNILKLLKHSTSVSCVPEGKGRIAAASVGTGQSVTTPWPSQHECCLPTLRPYGTAANMSRERCKSTLAIVRSPTDRHPTSTSRNLRRRLRGRISTQSSRRPCLTSTILNQVIVPPGLGPILGVDVPTSTTRRVTGWRESGTSCTCDSSNVQSTRTTGVDNTRTTKQGKIKNGRSLWRWRSSKASIRLALSLSSLYERLSLVVRLELTSIQRYSDGPRWVVASRCTRTSNAAAMS